MPSKELPGLLLRLLVEGLQLLSQEPAQFALSHANKTESVLLGLCSSVGIYFYRDSHFMLLLLSLVPSLS